MKQNNINIILAVFLVILVASARVVNAQAHIPNMVPIAAIGLFSGFIMKDKRGFAFLIPLLGQFLGDVYFQLFTNIKGFYDVTGMLFNYGGLVGATALGFAIKQPKPLTTAGFLLGGSTVFFLLSNFGYFMQGWNGFSFGGFMKTYVDAVPFYNYTMLADMVGGVILFGGYALLMRKMEQKAVKVKA